MIVTIFFKNMVIGVFLACFFIRLLFHILSMTRFCDFSASEMTYIVSSGALNSTHSLLWFCIISVIILCTFSNKSLSLRKCGDQD